MSDEHLPLTHQRPSWVTLVMPAIALLAATFLAYWPGLNAPLIFDDLTVLTGAGSVIERTLRDPWSLLSTNRPLVDASFTLGHLIHGPWPMGHRLVNVGLHLLAGLVLMDVVRRTLSAPAFNLRWVKLATPLAMVIAGLWLVHPVNTQAVTYLVQRSEVLATLMIFISLDALAMASGGGRAGKAMLGVSLLACIGAMLSKEIGYVTPLLLWLYGRTYWAGSFKAAWKANKLYYTLITLTLLIPWAMGVSRFLIPGADTTPAAGQMPLSAGVGAQGVGSMLYFFSQQSILVHYLHLIFWPVTLVLDYRYGLMEPAAFTAFPSRAAELSLTLMVSLGVLTLWALWRRPTLGFLGAWFFLLMAPTSSFMPIVDLAMEHRIYAASAAVIALTVMAIMLLWQAGEKLWPGTAEYHRLAGGLIFAVVMVLLGWRTFERNQDYANPVMLWAEVLKDRPDNTRAMLILGKLIEPRQPDHTLMLYQRAARTEPHNYEPMIALGSLYLENNQPQLARKWYVMAYRLSGDSRTYLMNMGLIAQEQNDLVGAAHFFQQAILHSQGDVKLLSNMGMVFDQLASQRLMQGQADSALELRLKAIEHLKTARQQDPNWRPAKVNLATALSNLGMQHQLAGRGMEAKAALEESLSVEPRVETARRLAWLMATWTPALTDNWQPVVDLARQAMQSVEGTQPLYMDTYAAALARAGDFEHAIEVQQNAIAVARSAAVEESKLEGYLRRLTSYQQRQPWLKSVQP